MNNNFCPAGFESDSQDDEEMMFYDSDGYNDLNNEDDDLLPHEHKKGFLYSAKKSKFSMHKFGEVKYSTQMNGDIIIDDIRQGILKRNINTVKQYLLQKGLDLDMPLRSGWTALMYACNYGNLPAAKLLIEAGADVNCGVDLFTPLMAACICENTKNDVLDIVQLLFDHGARINDNDRYHMTALMYAARECKLSVVQFLVSQSTSIDTQDNKGYTALTWAASRGHLKICKYLVDKGADPCAQTLNGSTPSEIADIHSQTLTCDFLNRCSNGDDQMLKMESLPDTESVEDKKQRITQYGDLELFLSGLDLKDFILHFHQHHIDFETFLKMTNDDLVEVGINQLGVRKKILNATYDVHKKTWQSSSLPSIQYSKAISSADAISMVSNVNKHVVYMTSTISYVDHQLKNKPETLEGAPEGATLNDVSHCINVTLGNLQQFYTELGALRRTLSKMEMDESYKLSDLCTLKAKHQKKSYLKKFFQSATFALTIVGVTYIFKHYRLHNLIPQLFHR